MLENIQNSLSSHIDITQKCTNVLLNHIYTASIILEETIKMDKKIYFLGNDVNRIISQYLSVKFNQKEGRNISFVLESNDEEKIFENQVKSFIEDGDLLIAISTSGNSKNVLRGLSLGKNIGCKTMGLSGYDGGAMNEFCDINIVVPSNDISHIHEMHLVIGSILKS